MLIILRGRGSWPLARVFRSVPMLWQGGGGGTQGHMRQGGVNGAVKKLIFLLSLPTKEKILGPKCTLHLYSNITYIKHSFVTLKLQFPLCTSKDFTKFQLIPKAHLHLDPSLFCVLYIVYLWSWVTPSSSPQRLRCLHEHVTANKQCGQQDFIS